MDGDRKVISLGEVKLERTGEEMRGLFNAISDRLYEKGEVYQRVLTSKVYLTGGFSDALAWIAVTDKNENPVIYEWAAAVTRHFSLEQVQPFGMTRMMYLMQYLQLCGHPVPIGNIGLIVVSGPGLDGVAIERRFEDITADEIQSVTRARLKAQAKAEGYSIDDLPLASEFDHPDDLPDWLGLPQDHLVPLDDETAAMVEKLEAKLGSDSRVSCSMRGGEMRCQIRMRLAESNQLMEAFIASAPKPRPELELVKSPDDES